MWLHFKTLLISHQSSSCMARGAEGGAPGLVGGWWAEHKCRPNGAIVYRSAWELLAPRGASLLLTCAISAPLVQVFRAGSACSPSLRRIYSAHFGPLSSADSQDDSLELPSFCAIKKTRQINYFKTFPLIIQLLTRATQLRTKDIFERGSKITQLRYGCKSVHILMNVNAAVSRLHQSNSESC